MPVYYIGSIPESDYLRHYGIPGMKWGVRRYQNTDGSLTSEGKIRYKSASNEERITLKNLKAMKKDSARLSRMNDRQRARLDEDIDFYTKRLTGEVKAKGKESRENDLFRSASFEKRALSYSIAIGMKAVAATAFGCALSRITTGHYDVASNAGHSFLVGAGQLVLGLSVDELYSRAVGRY